MKLLNKIYYIPMMYGKIYETFYWLLFFHNFNTAPVIFSAIFCLGS